MLDKGPARKVVIYVNEDAKYHQRPAHDAILAYLLEKGVAGATATRAMAGFGSHRVKHSASMEALAEHLPIRIEFIESPLRVDDLLPMLQDMVADGLIEVHDTTVVKTSSAGRKLSSAIEHERQAAAGTLMRIYLGESDRWEGEPLYDVILRRFRALEICGATVYRGILGYGIKGHTHKSGFLGISHDLPIVIAVVDSREKLAKAVDAIEPILTDALIVFSDVEYVRLIRKAADPGHDAPA